jgi:hypothetical protein
MTGYYIQKVSSQLNNTENLVRLRIYLDYSLKKFKFINKFVKKRTLQLLEES